MDILTALESRDCWLSFLEYRKNSCRLTENEEKQLQDFIDQEAYLPIVSRMRAGEPFPHPRKAAISKKSTSKKRIVYIYPDPENLVLKMLTHLLLRRYDYLFCPNLYSFRAGHGVKEAIHYLTSRSDISRMYTYKVDISNYFNSIPVAQLLPLLKDALVEDPEVYRFLEDLLTDTIVIENGQPHTEEKGIMAGCPVSTFLANLYLAELDQHFHQNHWLYARYSDDIILFAPTESEREERIRFIHQVLNTKGLHINPEKEEWSGPSESWVFLGIIYRQGVVDVAPASVEKIKAKMRRKMRALKRWADRKNVSGVNAAKAFIRVFNSKLFENPVSNDLTWARWFFPLITTDTSLRVIDQYAQQCIRTLATGKHTKAAFSFRYEQMKQLGYISLVNQYYKHKSAEKQEENVAKSE